MELVCGGPHLDEGNSKTIEKSLYRLAKVIF